MVSGALPFRCFASAHLNCYIRTETLRLFPIVYVYIPTYIEAYGKYRNYSSQSDEYTVRPGIITCMLRLS